MPNLDDMFHRAALDADGPNRWDYYRTPSEYLVEKTPQGHRRIRGAAHKGLVPYFIDSEIIAAICSIFSILITTVQHQLLTSPKTTEISATSQHSEAMPVSNISFPGLVSAESKLASESGRSSYATTLPYSSSSSSQRSSPLFSSVAHVDLHVTNLDQSIGAKEMKTLLVNVFKQHVMVMAQFYRRNLKSSLSFFTFYTYLFLRFKMSQFTCRVMVTWRLLFEFPQSKMLNFVSPNFIVGSWVIKE